MAYELYREPQPDGSIIVHYADGTTSTIPAPTITSGTTGGTTTTATYSWTNPLSGEIETFNSAVELQARQTAISIQSATQLQFQSQQFSATQQLAAQQFSAQQQLASQQYSTMMYTQQVNYAEQMARQSAFDVLMSEFSKYGLSSLVEPLRGMLTQNVSPSEFAIRLRETDAYKQRFIANEARIANGLRALGPAEYLANEDAYRQTLRAYGLTAFDNDAYVRKFLENDMSPSELNTRVVDAVQRVQMADPNIKNALKLYYGLSDTEITTYILDPKNMLPEIEKRITAGEIGGAALGQGLSVSATTAEELATYGVTKTQAQQGYQTIADVLPTAGKLSQIYGSTLEGYGQTQAEQEVFKGTASAKRARERLVGREMAAFQGQAGVQRGTLQIGGAGTF